MQKLTKLVLLSCAIACADNSYLDAPENIHRPLDTSASFARVGSVTISPWEIQLAPGATYQLTATVNNLAGNRLNNSTVEWSSSNVKIAVVSASGLLTAVAAGYVQITAYSGGKSAVMDVVVTGDPVTPSSPTSPEPSQPPPQESPTPNNTGSGLSGLAFKSDTYGYASTAAFLANVGSGYTYSYVRNPQLAEIDKTVTYNGHPTLKYNQPGGTDATPEVSVQFPASSPSLSSFWYRAKIRFQPGWTTTGTLTSSANAYKIFGWGWATSDGRGTLELTNTNEYQLSSDVRTPSSSFGWASAGYTSTEWTDGAWYDLIIHFETNSSSTTRTRMWLARDGETPKLRATMNATVNGTPPKVDRISLGMNFNQVRAASQTQALWYGQWEVIDGTRYANPFGL